MRAKYGMSFFLPTKSILEVSVPLKHSAWANRMIMKPNLFKNFRWRAFFPSKFIRNVQNSAGGLPCRPTRRKFCHTGRWSPSQGSRSRCNTEISNTLLTILWIKFSICVLNEKFEHSFQQRVLFAAYISKRTRVTCYYVCSWKGTQTYQNAYLR